MGSSLARWIVLPDDRQSHRVPECRGYDRTTGEVDDNQPNQGSGRWDAVTVVRLKKPHQVGQREKKCTRYQMPTKRSC